jgi:molybdate transport system substrate-binding protein
VGILALALVLNPELSKKGGYYLIPDTMHNPLEQGFIITKMGASKIIAKQFADYMGSKQVRSIMTKYGFALPGEKAGK